MLFNLLLAASLCPYKEYNPSNVPQLEYRQSADGAALEPVVSAGLEVTLQMCPPLIPSKTVAITIGDYPILLVGKSNEDGSRLNFNLVRGIEPNKYKITIDQIVDLPNPIYIGDINVRSGVENYIVATGNYIEPEKILDNYIFRLINEYTSYIIQNPEDLWKTKREEVFGEIKNATNAYENNEFEKIYSHLTSKVVPGSNGSICGKYMTVMHLYENEANLPAFIASQRFVYGDAFVNPTSLTFPNESASESMELALDPISKRAYNLRQMQQIRLLDKDGDRFIRETGVGTNVFVIDTAQSDERDEFIGNYKLNIAKNPFSPPIIYEGKVGKHGAIVGGIIKSIARNASVRYKSACTKDQCDPLLIVKAICEIVEEAQSKKIDPSKTIINLSLGSQSKGKIIKLAIEDAESMGMAVVLSYGNDDRCRIVGLPRGSYCYQYPADYRPDWDGKAIFSVAASILDQDGKDIGSFNRGVGSTYRAPTAPDLFMPGVFYKDLNGLDVDDADLQLRAGTSFAAPVLSATLSLWRELHTTEPWPNNQEIQKSEIIKPYLDLPCFIYNICT